MVTIDGTVQDMGRWPDAGYGAMDLVSGSTQFTDNDLTDAISLGGHNQGGIAHPCNSIARHPVSCFVFSECCKEQRLMAKLSNRRTGRMHRNGGATMGDKQSNSKIATFGEVLIDRFPDRNHIGGAAMNVAVHLRRLGIAVDLFTAVGNDEDGRKIRQFLEKEKLTKKVSQARRLPTGYAEVKSEKGKNFFRLEMLSAWSEIAIPPSENEHYQLLYFGSLAGNSAFNQRSLDQLRATQRETRLFCDLNIRMPHCNSALTDWCLTRADILKISDEELEQFTRWYGLPTIYTDALSEIIARWNLDMVFLTRGADGSCCLDKSGRLLTADAIPVENVADTVGAGDSFTAMILEGLFRERSLRESLQRASRFSSFMCTISGALPESNDFYSEFD